MEDKIILLILKIFTYNRDNYKKTKSKNKL